MNTLIIFAHPEPNSFNARLKEVAVETLEKTGNEVRVSDLYRMNFEAKTADHDFNHFEKDYFDLQAEQKEALQHHNFSPEIMEEQAKLHWADLVIFQFPLWWQSCPAILKGYFDRVLSLGFAYGTNFALKGKKALVSTTTGGSSEYFSDQGVGDIELILRPILFGTFAFCEMNVLKPYTVYSAKKLDDEQKDDIYLRYSQLLETLDTREIIYKGYSLRN